MSNEYPQKKQEIQTQEGSSNSQSFLDAFRSVFQLYAEDSSLTIEVTPDAKRKGTFFIDLEKGKIHVNPDAFLEKGWTKEQIVWACLHELEHFADMKSDPLDFLANFDYMRGKDKEFGSMKPYHTLYNCLDDIKVNTSVAKRAGFRYDDKTSVMGQKVSELYKEKLFPHNDFTSQPKHLQFAYALLRGEMLDEPCTVHSDVEKILQTPIMIKDKAWTLAGLMKKVSTPYFPRELHEAREKKVRLEKEMSKAAALPSIQSTYKKELEKTKNYLANVFPPRVRYELIKKYIEPLYTKLLEQDKKEMSEEQMQKSYQEMEASDFHDIPEEEIEKFVRAKAKEKEMPAPSASTPPKPKIADKTKEFTKDAKNALDKAFQIPPASRAEHDRVLSKVTPYISQLQEAFEKMITESRELVRVKEGYYSKGIKAIIKQLIAKYATVLVDNKPINNLRIYEKLISEWVEIMTPKNIRVHTIVDLSGSMEGEKAGIQQECVLLIEQALRMMRERVMQIRSSNDEELNPELTTDSEIIGFGTEEVDLKKLREYDYMHAQETIDEMNKADQADVIIAMGAMKNPNMVATRDSAALERVRDSLSAERSQKIATGDVIDLVYFFTDGGSDTKIASKKAVEDMVKSGMRVFAFQLGNVSESDKKTFREIWGERGYAVTNVSELPLIISAQLEGMVGGIRI